jgi:hypothetical protein
MMCWFDISMCGIDSLDLDLIFVAAFALMALGACMLGCEVVMIIRRIFRR